MRTTIEISDALRARLLELAARRGQKGFSRIVEEAIEHFLAGHADREERISDALAVLGTLDETEALHLEASVRKARGSWR